MTDVRLIDADTVVTIQVFDEMTEEYRMETITIAKAIDRWSDEGCPPTIDAVPVVHARWKWEGRFKACSECGTYNDWDNTLGAGHWHYCPNCGAKMDGGANNA